MQQPANQQPICIQPRVLQFTLEQNKQSINITNNTNMPIQHLYFTLFNREKYEFRPMVFSLDAGQSIEIIVCNLLKNNQYSSKAIGSSKKSDSSAFKDLVYLKWKGGNKRIPIYRLYAGKQDFDKQSQLMNNECIYQTENDKDTLHPQKTIVPINKKQNKDKKCKEQNILDKYTSLIITKQKKETQVHRGNVHRGNVHRDNEMKQTTKLPKKLVHYDWQNPVQITEQIQEQTVMQNTDNKLGNTSTSLIKSPVDNNIAWPAINHINQKLSQQIFKLQHLLHQQELQLSFSKKQLQYILNEYSCLRVINEQQQQQIKQLIDRQTTIKSMYSQQKNQIECLQQQVQLLKNRSQQAQHKYEELSLKQTAYIANIKELEQRYQQVQTHAKQLLQSKKAFEQRIENMEAINQELTHTIQQEINNRGVMSEEIQKSNQREQQLQILKDKLKKQLQVQKQGKIQLFKQIQRIQAQLKQTNNKLRQQTDQRNNNQQQYHNEIMNLQLINKEVVYKNNEILQEIQNNYKIIEEMCEKDHLNRVRYQQLLKDQKNIQDEKNKVQSQLEQSRKNISELLQNVRKFNHFYDMLEVQVNGLAEEYNLSYPIMNKGKQINTLTFLNNLSKEISLSYIPIEREQAIQKQNDYLTGRLQELEKHQTNKHQPQQAEQKALLEFVRAQMQKQYREMHQSLQLSELKYKHLKINFYQEYRSKIINVINNKNKANNIIITELQHKLQLFINNLSNYSHKQAVLAKQIKAKNQARKQIKLLKQKLSKLSQLPTKTYTNNIQKIQENKQYWLQCIKQQTIALTLTTKNMHLQQQLTLLKLTHQPVTQQINELLRDARDKQSIMAQLQQQIIILNTNMCEQKQNYTLSLENMKHRYQLNKQCKQQSEKLHKITQQSYSIRQQLQSKTQQIRQLKQQLKNHKEEREKLLQDIEIMKCSYEKYEKDLARMQDSLASYRGSNEQYRNENKQIRQQLQNALRELNIKNNLAKMYRNHNQQLKIRVALAQDNIADYRDVRNDDRFLADDIKYQRTQNNNKQIDGFVQPKKHLAVRQQLNFVKTQKQLIIKSLQSTIRSLGEIIVKIFSQLQLTIMKNNSQQLQHFRQKYENLWKLLDFQKNDYKIEIDLLAVDAAVENLLTVGLR